MPEKDNSKVDRKFNQSLAKGLEIIRVFSPGDRGLSNAQLSKRTGIPKPTVTRLTYTLKQLGYLSVSETSGRYFIHPHVLTLGYSVLSQLDIRQVARPLMQELANSCHGAVGLSMRDGFTMVLLERTRDRLGRNLALDIGSGVDIATSAMGRAYIAALSDDDRSKFLDELRQSDKERWPSIAPGIEKALKDYRERGYCVSVGEFLPEINGVGVPLILRDRSLFVLNCSGLSSYISPDMFPDLGNRLLELARIVQQSQGEVVSIRRDSEIDASGKTKISK